VVTRWKELTSPTTYPVSLVEAKTALRVVDTTSVATKANRLMGTSNSQIFVVAKQAGSIGNQYAVRLLVSGNNTALSVSLSGTVLTIRSATNGSGIATSTANDVIAAAYSVPEVAALFDFTHSTGTGTGVVAAASQANLTGVVDSGDEDSYISLLIAAATDVVEALTGQMFISRDVRAYFDEWEECMELPTSPVQQLLSVVYDDSNGDEQDFTESMILDADDHQLPAVIYINPDFSYPTLQYGRMSTVRVDYTAGYTTIPAKIKQCILFLVSHWYNQREPVINGTAVLANQVPYTFETVLNSFRLITV